MSCPTQKPSTRTRTQVKSEATSTKSILQRRKFSIKGKIKNKKRRKFLLRTQTPSSQTLYIPSISILIPHLISIVIAIIISSLYLLRLPMAEKQVHLNGAVCTKKCPICSYYWHVRTWRINNEMELTKVESTISDATVKIIELNKAPCSRVYVTADLLL